MRAKHGLALKIILSPPQTVEGMVSLISGLNLSLPSHPRVEVEREMRCCFHGLECCDSALEFSSRTYVYSLKLKTGTSQRSVYSNKGIFFRACWFLGFFSLSLAQLSVHWLKVYCHPLNSNLHKSKLILTVNVIRHHSPHFLYWKYDLTTVVNHVKIKREILLYLSEQWEKHRSAICISGQWNSLY